MFKSLLRVLYRCIEFCLGKFGFILIRGKMHMDCAFLPYFVEYKSTQEDTNKMLAHIGEIWNNYGKYEAYWSVLTADTFLKKHLGEKKH